MNKTFLGVLLGVGIMILIFGVSLASIWTIKTIHSNYSNNSTDINDESLADDYGDTGSSCYSDVSFIHIYGEIQSPEEMDSSDNSDNSSSSDDSNSGAADSPDILSQLEDAQNDSSTKAVVLVIDSPGGSPQASEQVADAIKSMTKPVYALIESQGDSGAYWIASAANQIYAWDTSEVGSIGVTGSYLDNAQQDAAEGIQFESLASGQFKDTGDPDKPLTAPEKALLMRDVMATYNIFVSTVAQNRHLPVAQVQAIADGSTMLGAMALQNGLIDSDGGWTALQAKLNQTLGLKDTSDCGATFNI